MADGYIEFSVKLDAADAEKELANLKKKILGLEKDLSAQNEVKSGLEEKLQRASNAAQDAKLYLESLRAEQERLRSLTPYDDGYFAAQKRLPEISAEIKEQETVVRSLYKEYDAAAAAVEKQNDAIARTEASLHAAKGAYGAVQQMAAAAGDGAENAASRAGEAAGQAGDRAENAASRASAATVALTSRMNRLINRITGLAKRVLFFSLITRALRGVREFLGKTLLSNEDFAAALAKLKGATLTAFAPIWNYAIPALTALINYLAKAMQAVASFVATLFGSTLEESAEAAQNLYDEANAINKVGGSAGKAAKSLASFDEINQLSSGGGGGVSADFSSLENGAPISKLKELFNSIDFSSLLKSFADLKETLSGLGSVIKNGLGWAWENVLVPLAVWTIEDAVPELVRLLASAFDLLRAVLEKLGPILKPLWDDVLKPLFEWLGKLVLSGLRELSELLGSLTDLIDGDISFDEFIRGLDGVKASLLLLGGVSVLSAIGKATNAIATIPSSVGAAIPKLKANLSKMAKTAGIGALAVADAVLVAYDVNKLKEASNAYRDAMDAHTKETNTALSTYKKLYEEKGKEVADEWALMVYNIDTSADDLETAQKRIAGEIEKHWDGVPQNMWEGFKQGWNNYFGANGVGLWQLIKDAFSNVIQWLKDLLGIHSPSTVMSGIGSDMAQGLWNGFKATWDQFYTWLTGAWQSVKTWWNGNISSVFTAAWWSTKFASIGTGMKTALNGVITAVENAINWIVDKLNLLSIDIPPIFGAAGVHIGFNLPTVSIPRLAQGAVIPPNREFLAVLGDQKRGTNIEAPLDTIVAAFRQAMDEYGGGDMRVTVNIGDDQIVNRVIRGINRQSRASGGTVINA